MVKVSHNRESQVGYGGGGVCSGKRESDGDDGGGSEVMRMGRSWYWLERR